MTDEKLYLQAMVKQHADASGAIVQLQTENAELREALNDTLKFLVFLYKHKISSTNEVAFDLDIYKEQIEKIRSVLTKKK